MKIKLVLADDHPAVIAGVQHVLSAVPTIEIVGSARNSTEIIELLTKLHCDILVTDYAMPGGKYGDGMTLLAFLRRRFPHVKLVLYTTLDNAAMAKEVSKLGIVAVVNKMDEVTHLVSAIHTAYATTNGSTNGGENLFANAPRDKDKRTACLTHRELEVVRLFVSGLTVNEIAAQLHRTKQTVSSQKGSAMRKLGIERDADLFRYAYEVGLAVSSEPHVVP